MRPVGPDTAGTVVAAHVVARLLGIRLLTLEAVVTVDSDGGHQVAAAACHLAEPWPDRPVLGDLPMRRPAGRLARAVQLTDQSASALDRSRGARAVRLT